MAETNSHNSFNTVLVAEAPIGRSAQEELGELIDEHLPCAVPATQHSSDTTRSIRKTQELHHSEADGCREEDRSDDVDLKPMPCRQETSPQASSSADLQTRHTLLRAEAEEEARHLLCVASSMCRSLAMNAILREISPSPAVADVRNFFRSRLSQPAVVGATPQPLLQRLSAFLGCGRRLS